MPEPLILFVDDEKTLCEKLATSFELEDFKCLTAFSGNEAIEILKTNTDIQFIVTDMKMPNGDGLHLLKYVRSNLDRKIPVLFLSGFTEKNEADLQKMGAEGLMIKPTNIDNLINYVRARLKDYQIV